MDRRVLYMQCYNDYVLQKLDDKRNTLKQNLATLISSKYCRSLQNTRKPGNIIRENTGFKSSLAKPTNIFICASMVPKHLFRFTSGGILS